MPEKAVTMAKTTGKPSSSLVLTIGVEAGKPWWLEHLGVDRRRCRLSYERLTVFGRSDRQLRLRHLPFLLAKIGSRVLRSRKVDDYLFTFETGWASWIVSFLQTITFTRRPKHVILQFIMRERQPTARSRIKYLVMRFCFGSVHLVVCSSNPEMEYYRSVFGWEREKTRFVPFHTDPKYLRVDATAGGGHVLAAGRTYRDYKTFLKGVSGLALPVVIAASPSSELFCGLAQNVTLRFDVPQEEFAALVERSLVVVVPLEDRAISTGQSVILQAMAMGKPVIATRTSGTVDYLEHMKNGILVDPGDHEGIRREILRLAADPQLSSALGAAARRSVLRRHLPQHYFDALARALESGKTPTSS